MGLIVTIIIGFFIGLIAKFLMPGRDPAGFIITILLGIGGALTANFLGRAMGLYASNETSGFIASVIGAMVLLAIYRVFSGRRITH
jgi:uncharacterized membrane protein YeaQ/YmgE (transglycosylase-associated protein family)